MHDFLIYMGFVIIRLVLSMRALFAAACAFESFISAERFVFGVSLGVLLYVAIDCRRHGGA